MSGLTGDSKAQIHLESELICSIESDYVLQSMLGGNESMDSELRTPFVLNQ